ncbi:hypothetical protein NEIG_00666 [Nematocida sp. ERTm5]|nr:hypothetical protein NEIRO02_1905 [Nematocida sp. AWRm79]KAI5185021.1 hypothetical protein NEIRO03_1903 [Nematocida sp. AWRm78]OAG31069.1 hypothetical protein NEIG_00666 [Nematocida sp. ERTm5]
MENRRPIRIQKKEEIFRIKEAAHPVDSSAPAGSTNSINANKEEDSDETTASDALSTEEEDEVVAKKQNTSHVLKYATFYWSAIMCIVVGYLFHRVNHKCDTRIKAMAQANHILTEKINQLESLLHSKHREIDVADYLEGARIIHDLTTDSFVKKGWLNSVKGLGAEVAIDRVCTKYHCYSFKGSEGKLAIAFKNEKVIRKIGVIHPSYDNKSSAMKSFFVDCIVNNNHVCMGEFEYEVPGDAFQQFLIPPTKCTGIVFRIKSNHGKKEYTCIYKVYAFE